MADADSIRTLCKNSKIVIPTLETHGICTLDHFIKCDDQLLAQLFRENSIALRWAKIFRRRARELIQSALYQKKKEEEIQNIGLDNSLLVYEKRIEKEVNRFQYITIFTNLTCRESYRCYYIQQIWRVF